MTGGKIRLLEKPERVFYCASPLEVRDSLPEGVDVLAFQCRNPIHKAHYELFIRALEADNVSQDAVCLVHPTCGPTQVLHILTLAFLLPAKCLPLRFPPVIAIPIQEMRVQRLSLEWDAQEILT